MRAFIAIDFDDAVKRDLARLIERLKKTCGNLQWVPPEKLHVTLKFLGEVNDQRIMPITDVLHALAAAERAFDIAIAGAGVFPPHGGVRVLWAGIGDPEGRVAGCQEAVENAIESLGLPRENRPFSPHLTLARNNSPANSNAIRSAIAKVADYSAGTQTVGGLVLYQSRQTPKGSVYEPISTHEFTR